VLADEALERPVQRGVAGHGRARVDGLRERGGEHDSGQRGQPGVGGARQRARLAAGELGVKGGVVAQVDQERVGACGRAAPRVGRCGTG
jgi:hypothetical protein